MQVKRILEAPRTRRTTKDHEGNHHDLRFGVTSCSVVNRVLAPKTKVTVGEKGRTLECSRTIHKMSFSRWPGPSISLGAG
jgi:hypothetical protein